MRNKEVDFNNKGFNKFLNDNCSNLRLNSSKQVIKIDIENTEYEIVSDGFIRIVAIVKLDSDFGVERYEAFVNLRFKGKDFSYCVDEERQFKIRFKVYLSQEYKKIVKYVEGVDNASLRNLMEVSIVNPVKFLELIQLLGSFAVYDKRAFVNALEQYLIYKLLKSEGQNEVYTFSAGWNDIKKRKSSVQKEYLGVTTDSWDEDFSKSMRLHGRDEDQDSSLINASIEKLDQYVLNSPVTAMAFLYNILAISHSMVEESLGIVYRNNGIEYKGRIFPGMCVFGEKEGLTKKSVTNLLLNWFEVNPERLNSIKMSYNLHLDSAYHTNLSRNHSHDMPFIITSKDDLGTRDFLRVKSIISNDLIRFPVFISKIESPYKEIVDLNIGDMVDFPSERDKQLSIREAVDIVLVQFIFYLKIIFLHEHFPKKIANAIESKAKELLHNDSYDEEEAHFAMVFLVTTEIFNYFLIENGFGNITQKIYTKIKDFWIIRAKIYELKQSASELKDRFVCYIESIFSNETGSILHWESKERNGAKENCYYISHNGFVRSFCQYMGSSISEYEIYKMLKDTGIIKMRSNQASIGQYRIYNGKKIYALVLIKEKIEEIKRNMENAN